MGVVRTSIGFVQQFKAKEAFGAEAEESIATA
jgi:hypothetical protein